MLRGARQRGGPVERSERAAGQAGYSAHGPIPLTRSTAIRIRTPGGGSSIGGKRTSGPRYTRASS